MSIKPASFVDQLVIRKIEFEHTDPSKRSYRDRIGNKINSVLLRVMAGKELEKVLTRTYESRYAKLKEATVGGQSIKEHNIIQILRAGTKDAEIDKLIKNEAAIPAERKKLADELDARDRAALAESQKPLHKEKFASALGEMQQVVAAKDQKRALEAKNEKEALQSEFRKEILAQLKKPQDDDGDSESFNATDFDQARHVENFKETLDAVPKAAIDMVIEREQIRHAKDTQKAEFKETLNAIPNAVAEREQAKLEAEKPPTFLEKFWQLFTGRGG